MRVVSRKMNSSHSHDNSVARILIVDDHAAVRTGLRNLIGSRSGWLVCGEAADGDEAVALALETMPAAIVMDVSMPRMNGLEATRRIRERLPNVEILIVSQHDSNHVVREAQRAGARGFVMKSHLSADLLPALEAALLHSSRISAPVSRAWQEAIVDPQRPLHGSFADPGPHDDLDLMSGGGEMGALMRSTDWSKTPFGPVSEWPQSLRTALRICLDSRFPIVIWWGPELRHLYNDAWKPALGTTKHPRALGAPAREVWSDVWDTIGPMLEGVMRTGKATWENDQVLLFDRHGYVEESYWTYSYSAIRLSSGEVGGVFTAIHEVTDRVLNTRRLKTLREVADQIVQAKNEVDACSLAMQSIVRNPADCPFAMICLIDGNKATRVAASFDAGKLISSQFDLSREDSWGIQAAARTRSAQLFTVESNLSLPSAPFGSKCKQAISVPILASSREVVAVLTVGINPYRVLDDDYREFLESLTQNLAANIENAAKARARREGVELERKMRAEAELEGARFRQIIDALPAAIYTTDADGHITHFNSAAVEFSGRTPRLGSDQWCVTGKLYQSDGTPLPHDECPMAIALKEGRILEGLECIAERPDGTRVWFTPYPRPLRDATGKIVGGINMLVDITERKKTEQATNLLAAIVASSDDAIVSKNLDGMITSWNKSAERIFGYSAEEAVGQHVTLIIPTARLDEETEILTRLRRGERVENFETVRVRKDGTLIDVSLTISPVKDSTGRVVGASKVARDITAQKRTEEDYRNLAEHLESEVRLRTKELEERNSDILRQSQRLHDLSWRLLRTQDVERRHIARELHDSAGQTLALLGMSLSQHILQAQKHSPELRDSAQQVEKLVHQLQNEIRTTSYLLHPPLLDEAGLVSALGWYVDGLRARSSLGITLHIPDDFGRLPRDLELVIFRLVQECLTNIHRHSGSQSASIRIRREKATVFVEVEDQGRGIPPDKLASIQAQGSGVGIRGMRERVLQFQGVLEISSASSGTKVSAAMHIPDAPREENEDSLRVAI